MDCFSSWVAQCWTGKLHFVAINGKTSRRCHYRKTGQKALHLVSAFATKSWPVLGRVTVYEKFNEITAIPALVACLNLTSILVSIDAMGCNAKFANRSPAPNPTTYEPCGAKRLARNADTAISAFRRCEWKATRLIFAVLMVGGGDSCCEAWNAFRRSAAEYDA
jgi:predicted transposase YbfD/YdcC